MKNSPKLWLVVIVAFVFGFGFHATISGGAKGVKGANKRQPRR